MASSKIEGRIALKRGVVIRFRVMALLAGVMSLLLWFVELPVVYLLDAPELAEKVKWIPFVHGYIYAFMYSPQFILQRRLDSPCVR